MRIDYTTGFTTEEVEEILACQKLELKKAMASYSDNGSSFARRRLDEVHAIIASCQRALQILDPDNYPVKPTVAQSRVVGYLPK